MPVDVDTIKQRLDIVRTDQNDMLLDFIKGAVARIDGPVGIGVAMMQQTWRKSLDAFPALIELPGAPITGVTAIKYFDAGGVEQTLPEADYHVDLGREPVRVQPAAGASWPATGNLNGAVVVEYQLGEADPANVPPDLIDAVCLLVGHRYENREAVNVGNIVNVYPLGFEAIVAEHRRCMVSS